MKIKESLIRTGMLIGEEALEKLAASRVAVFGVGGVGGYVTEALARSGVGALDLIDHDTVAESNLNRQIIALRSTIGRYKVDVMKERIADIHPDCTVRTHNIFYLPETEAQFDFTEYDYVVDAIDTVVGKLSLIEHAQAAGTPIISAMGAGNKLDPTGFKVADIYKTNGCPLARVMRRECKARDVKSLKVVYSEEKPLQPQQIPEPAEELHGRRSTPGSIAFVPAAAGLVIAGEVIRDLIKI